MTRGDLRDILTSETHAVEDNSGLNKDDRERFRGLLLERLAELTGDASGLESEAQNPGNGVRMPTHMADVASDASAVDDSLNQIETIGDEVRQIRAALQRLEGDSYGVCTGCGKPINPERLEALPFAELCIGCKQAEESGQGQT